MSLHATIQAGTSRSEALNAMLRGATVLTPNVRSARSLSRLHDAHQRSEGRTAWQPAHVLAWSGWTSSLWRDATVRGTVTSVLLNDLQEEALWTRIVDQSGDLGLRASAPVARRCANALKLLGSYDLEDRFARTSATENPDTAAFFGWYQEFMRACKRDALLPASHLEAEIASLFRSGKLRPKAEYVLYGFDDLTPAKKSLMQALEQAGATVQRLSAMTEQTATPVLVRCVNPHAEIDTCCRWILSTLEAHPEAEIAIIVPDLQECRPVLERAMRAIVAPWLEDVTNAHRSAPFEFSTGRQLAHLPMIADALRFLRWCASPISIDDAGALLRSPFLSLSPSPERGAELEAWVLRNTHKLRRAANLSGEITVREAERVLYRDASDTANRLHQLSLIAGKTVSGAHSYASFADRARTLLQSAGWPARELDSTEHQALQRWNETLDRVASLDLFGERIRFPEWIEAITAAAGETVFAPENIGAPVQVMTPTEAAGTTSDFLWFLHAGEDIWPQLRDPNPLLPRAFQRALSMPGSDNVLDEQQACEVTQRCLHSTGSARFSYPEMRTEGESRPSPLIATLPGITPVAADVPEQTGNLIALEESRDTLPLPMLPANASGGVSILTSQGQCGFRAFAERRLQLAEMESIDAGLSPAERGEQVHAVLQQFWGICKTHEQLAILTKTIRDGRTERDILLQDCIERSMPAASAGWDEAYLRVQQQRLHRLLSDWLNVELHRSPFRVDKLEFEIPDAEVGPLHLKIRVDRIDRVPQADGTEAAVLIDYKTGAAERKDWFGDRPDAPQLPVYAIASRLPDVQGIAFGRVRVGKLGMDFQEMLADRRLLGDDVTTKRRTEPTFEERMAEWQRDITALAEAFARGEAVVEPKDYLTTCKRCASRLLCRVDVTRLEPDDDLLDESEEEAGA